VLVLAEWRAGQGDAGAARALLRQLLRDPGLYASLQIEAQRALDALGPAGQDDAVTPVDLMAALDAAIVDVAPMPAAGQGATAA